MWMSFNDAANNMVTLTQHRMHLSMLADHLETLPEEYLHFDMETYFHSPQHPSAKEQEELLLASSVSAHGCGTVACALGHGPAAGIAVPEGTQTWDDYAVAVFGINLLDAASANAFLYLFDGGWASIEGENTARAAARRIRTYLASGVPKDYHAETMFHAATHTGEP